MTAQTILPANSASSGGYEVANSLRFNPASNDRLTRTPSTTGNESRWTWSGWAKRGTDNQDLFLFGCDEDANNETHLKFGTGGDIRFLDKVGGSTNGKINTLAKFRDLSAWYHIVAVFDKDNSTATDRMILYVNGVRISAFDGSVMPGNSSILNKAELVEIGALDGNGDMNGYICEVCFIDGQALAADSFGEFDSDSGIWVPIKVSGLTFGDQGYYLEMKQVGTSQNSSGMGADTSGNDNHFAVVNLTAIDQTTDTCTNNFATLNPLFGGGVNLTLTEGNLKSEAEDAQPKNRVSTIAVSSGKWYAEFMSTAGDNYPGFGIMDVGSTLQTTVGYLGSTADSYSMFQGGLDYTNAQEVENIGVTWGEDVIMGIGIDLDSGTKTIKYYKAGSEVHSRTIATPANAYVFAVTHSHDNTISESNFGNPITALSSAVADENGFGAFEFAPPSGYLALCTKNLAESG